MNLLTVIAFNEADIPLAEHLSDWIYELSDRKQVGHCLLACASDVHGEWQKKIALNCELAFETVSVIQHKENKIVKAEGVNQLFKFAAYHVSQHYRVPWLWLDADCVPLKPDWREQIEKAYHSQPKRYMGGFYQVPAGDKRIVCLNRNSVYPYDAVKDLQKVCDNQAGEQDGEKIARPFERVAGDALSARATKCGLIQQCVYEGDSSKIRADAAILHSDKTGKLIELLRERLAGDAPTEVHRNGNGSLTPKIDMRTKAGRAMKKALV